jgi:hypothetical protein
MAMQILRHSRINITMEIYPEVPDEVTRAALKRLEENLDQPGRRVTLPARFRNPRMHPEPWPRI